MKRTILFFLLLLGAGIANAQSTNQNYVKTRTMTNEAGTVWLDNIQYFDGLGRYVQAVQKGITPSGTDLASFQEYDACGRESNAWLPVKVSGGNGAFVPLATLRTSSSSMYGDELAYSLPVYESSPLNRVISQTGPGADWHTNNKAVTTECLTNTDSGVLACKWYTTTDNRSVNTITMTNQTVPLSTGGQILTTDGLAVTTGTGATYYPAGELYVTKMSDEDGAIFYEFKDKLGQVLLTRQMEGSTAHDTYYVYDSYGNLRAVLPPLAADAMAAEGSWAETHATIKNYAYLYKYDNRNRCIAKKLPGADWVYYVYDTADRVIFTQDGEMRDEGKWMFTIPDFFGRVVLTGTCTNSIDYAANPLGTNAVRVARNNAPGVYKGYISPSGIALNNPVILLVNYYDDYAFMNKNGIPAATDENFKCETVSDYGTPYTISQKGLLTGTMTAQLNENGIISSYLYSIMYYDDRGRLIQAKSNNHLAGGIEKEYIGYNFSGQPVKRKLVHSATGKTTQTQLYENLYDHAGRLTQVKHGLNTSTAGTVIALNTYDDLGRLKTQKKGSLPATTFGYNVRSWTKSITNASLFSQTLYYNEVYGGSTKRYNGNISATNWKVGNETLRGYAFGYDGLSRLTSANYLLNGTANSNNTVSGITYDKHGNMKTIQRRGKTTASAYGVIDKLTMTYSGNQLTNVTDAGETVSLPESNDFKKGSSTNTGYAYNKNGSMTKDLNKSISAISYNLFNLPAQVTIAGVNHKYTYSADGRKLKVVQGSDSRDYVGSVIYENGSLKRILIDGGYIENGTYYYYLNDHLGNVRVVASGTGTMAQKNDYYPFGMPMAETGNSQQGVQPYKYNGKEFDRKDGLNLYDFEARQMDPGIGRFTTVDPHAERYFSISPYAYVANNPLNAIDPTGKKIIFVNGYWNSTLIGDMMSSKYPGKNYWGVGFGEAAQIFFNDFSSITDANYVDGSSLFGADQNARVRYSKGYEYAEKNYENLIANMEEGETFKFVTHSEGSAFGAGMISFLIKQGHVVETVIHLSAHQAEDFFTPDEPKTYQLGYAGDWITGNKMIYGVDKFGIVDKFQSRWDKIRYSHGSTKNARVYRDIHALVNAIVQAGGSFNVTETETGVTFTVIYEN